MGVSRSLAILAVCTGLSAFLYQSYVHHILLSWGLINRVVQPISDFPYTCQKIEHPVLQGCEDIFIDEHSRHLYAACQSVYDRHIWAPFAHRLNFSARSAAGASLVSIDLDKLSTSGDNIVEVATQQLPHPRSGFTSVLGNDDNTFDVLGFAGQRLVSPTGLLQFHIVNQRPMVNATTGKPIDHVDYDPSIELFEEVPAVSRTSPDSPTFTHVATYTDPLIVRPNRVVSDGHGGFYVSNDHSARVSQFLASNLEMLTGGGGIVHCPADTSASCKPVTGTLMGPNGITRLHRQNRILLPETMSGNIHVYEQMPDFSLRWVEKIVMHMPCDNLSPDANEDVWGAGCPKIIDVVKALNAEVGNKAWITSVMKVSRTLAPPATGYEFSKVLEDRDAEVIGGSTTVAHDVKTGNVWTSGINMPWVSVCRPNKT